MQDKKNQTIEKAMKRGWFVKAPQKGRKSFAIIGFEEAGGKRKNSTLKDSRVDAINKLYQSGAIDFERARAQCREVVADLYRKHGSKSQALRRSGLLKDNERVFNKFWDEVYEGRELVDMETAKHDYIRALKFLGSISIVSGSKAEIARALRSNANRSQHRRAVGLLNTILKFLGRDLRLQKPEAEIEEIRHVTLEDLERLCEHEEIEEYQLLYKTLFATGLRLGEAVALEPSSVLPGGRIYVAMQITTKGGKRKRPKRGKTGEVVILDGWEGVVREFSRLDDKFSLAHNATKRLLRLSRKLWPKEPKKHISAHCLRHSHAIHLLSLGIPMAFVAKNLRNGEAVCQKHYAGFSHSPATASAFKALMRAVTIKS